MITELFVSKSLKPVSQIYLFLILIVSFPMENVNMFLLQKLNTFFACIFIICVCIAHEG